MKATKMTKTQIKKEASKINMMHFTPNNLLMTVAGLNQLFDIDIQSKEAVAEIFAEYVKTTIMNMTDAQFEGANNYAKSNPF